MGIAGTNVVDCVWNVMAHAQKPDFFFRRNGRVHLSRRGRQFSRLLATEVCASAVVMLDTPCSEVVRRVLATHSIRQFPLHFPSRASPCAITFQLESTSWHGVIFQKLQDYVQGCLFKDEVSYWRGHKRVLLHDVSCRTSTWMPPYTFTTFRHSPSITTEFFRSFNRTFRPEWPSSGTRY